MKVSMPLSFHEEELPSEEHEKYRNQDPPPLLYQSFLAENSTSIVGSNEETT